MSNPPHSARVEAKLIRLESLRRAAVQVAKGEDPYTSDDMTPAYRRDVANYLASLYNSALDNSGFDGTHLPMQELPKKEKS